MTTLVTPAPAPTPLIGRRRWDVAVMPVVAVLIGVALRDTGWRPLLVLGVPLVALAATFHRWPRGAQAAGAAMLGTLALAGGVLTHSGFALAAGAAALAVGVTRGWGVNAGRGRTSAWIRRVATTLGVLVTGVLVVVPLATSIHYLGKPRQPIRESALGLPHERIAFRASDGVRLSGWWAPGANGAAVVIAHGGGGDREGSIAHARMLHRAGYGVLLYDARGRGRSDGRQNATGWNWHHDVRGAVDVLAARGFDHIGLLGLSTGAEAVVTEAAGDPRVDAVVADGVQARRAADAAHLPTGQRVFGQPTIAIAEGVIRAVSGERPPRPLPGLIRRAAADRPLLMIAANPIERSLQTRFARGTAARVWQVEGSRHVRALRDKPAEYVRRVTETLGRPR